MEKKEKPKMETYKFESEQDKLFKDPAYKAEVRKFRKEKERMYQNAMNRCREERELKQKKNDFMQQIQMECTEAKQFKYEDRSTLTFPSFSMKKAAEDVQEMNANEAKIVAEKPGPTQVPSIYSMKEVAKDVQMMKANTIVETIAKGVSNGAEIVPDNAGPNKDPSIYSMKEVAKDECVPKVPVIADQLVTSNMDSNLEEPPLDLDNDTIGYSPLWRIDLCPDGTHNTSTVYEPIRAEDVPYVAHEISITDGPLILLGGDNTGEVHYNPDDTVHLDIGESTLHILDPTEKAVVLVNEQVPLDLNELFVQTPEVGQESQGSPTDIAIKSAVFQ